MCGVDAEFQTYQYYDTTCSLTLTPSRSSSLAPRSTPELPPLQQRQRYKRARFLSWELAPLALFSRVAGWACGPLFPCLGAPKRGALFEALQNICVSCTFYKQRNAYAQASASGDDHCVRRHGGCLCGRILAWVNVEPWPLSILRAVPFWAVPFPGQSAGLTRTLTSMRSQ